MKEQTTGGKIAKRVLAWTLSAFLVVTMIPSLGFMAAGTGAKDPTGSTAKAAVPSDGTGWKATYDYFKQIYGDGNTISSLNAGNTLTGTNYIQKDISITAYGAGSNGIKISGKVRLILLNGAKLTVRGGDASDQSGGGAGILLPSGSELTVDGYGTLDVKGGNAANGENGQQGGNQKQSPWYDQHGDNFAGHGGHGGKGGGGAGAGIGTNGGAGASNYGSGGTADFAGKHAHSATRGGSGKEGSNSADSGTFKQYGNVTLNISGGDGGYGGYGGQGGNQGTQGKNPKIHRICNGSGGGGGGGGGRGNAIGSGGPGGGSGGGAGGSAGRSDAKGDIGSGGGGGAGGGENTRRAATGGGRGDVSGQHDHIGWGETGHSQGGFNGNYWDGGGSTPNYELNGDDVKVKGGGSGGRSGYYGSSGTVYTTRWGSTAGTFRYTADGNWRGGNATQVYWSYPKREVVMNLAPDSDGHAVLTNDGRENIYRFQNGNPVQPKITLTHVPTNSTISSDNLDSAAFGKSYVNASDQPTQGAIVNATANAFTKNIYNNNGSRPNFVGDDFTSSVTMQKGYKIDYPTYKVTLDAAGGIGTDIVGVKIGPSKEYAYQPYNGAYQYAPTREGYVFQGFYSEKDGKGTQYFAATATEPVRAQPVRAWNQEKNTTFYAKWKPLEYKIRFWSDYGNGSEYVEYNLDDWEYEKKLKNEQTGEYTDEDDTHSAKIKPATYGELILPSATELGISRDHYDFVGWNVYEEQDWAMYKAGKRYKAGLTTQDGVTVDLYAGWRAKDQLAVSYDANGGSGAPPQDGTWEDADYTISSQIPKRDTYTFKGWNTVAAPTEENPGKSYDPNEEVKHTDAEKAIKSSVTMYAQWEKNKSITYRANGGVINGEIPTEYPTKNTDVDIDYTTEVTRTGYDFVGWCKKDKDGNYEKDGSGKINVYVNAAPEEMPEGYVAKVADKVHMAESDIIMEALWTPQKMDIDFMTDNLWQQDGWRFGDGEGNATWGNPAGKDKEFNHQTVEYDDPFEFSVVVDDAKVDSSKLRVRINDINQVPERSETNNGKTTYFYKIAKVKGGQMIVASGLQGRTYPVLLDAGDGDLRGNVRTHTFGEPTNLPVRADGEDPETGDPIEGNTPVRKGYKFDGWFITNDPEQQTGTGMTEIPAAAIPTDEDGVMKYYAKWTSTKYNLVFDSSPLPGETDSVLNWFADPDADPPVTEADSQAEYESVFDVDGDNYAFKNIQYDSKKNMPTLNGILEYHYGPEGNKEKANFLGWSKKKNAAEPDYAPGQSFRRLTDEDNATLTLYPVWDSKSYAVVLDANGGELDGNVTSYKAGSAVVLPNVTAGNAPTRDGYKFDGWFTSPNPQEGDQPVLRISPADSGNKTFYAKWSGKEYQYTLKNINPDTGAEGESYITPDTNKMHVGEKATLSLPGNFTIPTYDLDGTPTEYQLVGWTDEYKVEGTEVKTGDVRFLAGDETDELWQIDENTGEFSGRTLYTVWKKQGTETVKYDANGGYGGADIQEGAHNAEVNVEFGNTPSRTGYNFVGWSENKNINPGATEGIYKKSDDPGNPTKITLNSSKRLYAVWQAVTYDITFDATGGKFEEEDTVTQKVDTYEDEVTLLDGIDNPTRVGYELLGWSTVANGSVEYQKGSKVKGFAEEKFAEESGDMSLEGKTLYAVWHMKDPAYLAFDANGGNGAPGMESHPKSTATDPTKVNISADVMTRVQPTRDGYTFKGWATEPDATEALDEVTMPEDAGGSVTVYAIWEKKTGLKISYYHDANGSAPFDPQVYYEGDTADISYEPAPNKTGYEFVGWDVRPYDNDGGKIDETSDPLAEKRQGTAGGTELELDENMFNGAKSGDPKTLYLKAAFKANEYTVKFDANGGEGEVESVAKKYGEDKALPSGDGLKAPAGYKFDGWNASPEGNGQNYAAGATGWELSNVDGDEVTLYANWVADAMNVEFERGDAQNITRELNYGDNMPEDITAPQKAGYDFVRYYLEEYAHDAEGHFLDADGNVVDSKNQAEIVESTYYGDNMVPQKAWEKTSADLQYQVAGKFILKAEWKAQKYSISYHDNDGVLLFSEKVTFGESVRMPDDGELEVPTGMRHSGWALEPESTVTKFEADTAYAPSATNGLYNPSSSGEAQTVSLYAVYTPNGPFYVTYDTKGGDYGPTDETAYAGGALADVSYDVIPKKDGYIFLGWSPVDTPDVLPYSGKELAGKYFGDTEKGCETIDGKNYHDPEHGGTATSQGEQQMSMTRNMTLYAVWAPKTYYSVAFDANSDNFDAIGGDEVEISKGEKKTRYILSANRYETKEKIYRTEAPYDVEGATKEIVVPDADTLFDNKADDGRQKFLGWAKDKNAKKPDYKEGEVVSDVTDGSKVTLYAVWAKPVKKVDFTGVIQPKLAEQVSDDIDYEGDVQVPAYSWSPSDSVFQGDTAYTLKAKMKADEGFFFDTTKEGETLKYPPEVSITYKDNDGNDQTVTTENGVKVSFNDAGTLMTVSYKFPATEATGKEAGDIQIDLGNGQTELENSAKLPVTPSIYGEGIKSGRVTTEWDKNEKVKPDTEYQAKVEMGVDSVIAATLPGKKVDFSGEQIQIIDDESEIDEGKPYALLKKDDQENYTLEVVRTFRSPKAEYESAVHPDEKTVAWGSAVSALGLPKEVTVKTNSGEYNAEVTWNTKGVNLSKANKREIGDTFNISGTVKLPDFIDNPDKKSLEVTVKVTVTPDQKYIDDKKKAEEAKKKAEEDAKKKAEEEKARKAAEEKAANTVNEKKGIQPGANMKAVEKFLLNRKSDTDPAGSTVAPLKVKSTKQTKKSIKVAWAKVKGAAKYVLYGNECGKTKKVKKIKLLKGKSLNVKKIGGKKLKKGKYHKFIVIAYNAKNKVVAVSKYIHVATKGGKVGNHKRVDVKIKKGKKWKKIKKATVKKGKKLRLKAVAIKAGGKKIKVKKHRKVIFESSNTKIAKVTKKGVVKGVKKGKAKIHAYAQNGVLRTITVTVK